MGFACDNAHAEGTAAFIVMTQPETGDTDALCAPCLMEWAYAMLAGSDMGTDLLKGKMLKIAAEAKAAEAKPKRGRGKPSAEAEGTGEATEAIAEATDTPDPE